MLPWHQATCRSHDLARLIVEKLKEDGDFVRAQLDQAWSPQEVAQQMQMRFGLHLQKN